MADVHSEFRPNLAAFGVPKRDPGWIYLVRNNDLYKIGKTKNPNKRLNREAKTWLPDLEIIALKPFWNISSIENTLHTAFTWHWHAKEWFRFLSDDDRDFLIEGLRDFYDEDRDMNSVDFIYWVNGSGMSEFMIERTRQRLTLPQWHQSERQRAKTPR
jgi:hypothetical protein